MRPNCPGLCQEQSKTNKINVINYTQTPNNGHEVKESVLAWVIKYHSGFIPCCESQLALGKYTMSYVTAKDLMLMEEEN